jgi:hypothetical protein
VKARGILKCLYCYGCAFFTFLLVFVNNLLINEANPESNESAVNQHSGISIAKRVYCQMNPITRKITFKLVRLPSLGMFG